MDFEIDTPCDEPWENMQPRGDGRFCDRCQHTVIDLSRMTRKQAESRIGRVRKREVCVRLAVHAETGEAVFRREPMRRPRGLVLAAALTAGGCVGSASAGSSEEIARVEAEQPPCELGPPMMPVETELEPTPATGPVRAEELVQAEQTNPTHAQQALTDRKNNPRAAAIHSQRMGRMPIQMMRGGMRLPND